MLGLIGSAFSWLTGNSKSAEKASSGIDMMIYTDEEKSIAGDARNEKILDFKIRYAEVTQKQSIARRVIAFGFTAVFLFLVLIIVVSGYFERGAGSYAEFVYTVLKDLLLEPQGYIIMFYFAAHIVGKLGKK